MNVFQKIKYNQNWNIGFCEQTPEDFVARKALNKIHWMKHSYKDRWFADPFILKVTEEEIVVFVEECPIDHPKGVLCELVLDRKSKWLKQRYLLLESQTHLSYPQIIRQNNKVYVCPENGASGKLNIYEYDAINHRLIAPVCILEENLGDATLVKKGDEYYLLATKYPALFEDVLLFHSASLMGQYTMVVDSPAQKDRSCARPGGAFFYSDGQLYRPAQDCVERYGSALSIMKIQSLNVPMVEDKDFIITAESYKYNLGIHTINFYNGICVVDGYGYYYPIIGRLYHHAISQFVINKIKQIANI
jgi:hypothetical protein